MSENDSWQAPLWLTNDYLQEVLQQYLKDETVEIETVDIRPVNPKGENYASVMSRLRIKFKTSTEKTLQELSFIMKYSYESDPFLANIMAGYEVYQTEMEMYEKILPQLAELLQNAGDKEHLFAKTLKVDYDKSTIIFEDLAVKNYIMADRLKGLDEDHCRLSLKKLAKFHAAAAVLNERENGILEKYDHGIFNRHFRGFGCIFEHLFEEAAHFAKECPELGDYYSDKLLKLVPYCVEYGTRAYYSRPKSFYTLSHGDFWVNNTMMLYDNPKARDKQLKDMLLIDFQFCNWSSPAVDLHYFFNTSLEPQLLMDNSVQEKIVQYYHAVLSDTLRKLKYKGRIPTFHELCVQLEEGRFLGKFCKK